MFDPKYPPNFILVQFDMNGKSYLYQSPFSHKIGDLVLVNTYGKIKVCKVVEQSTNRYVLDTDYRGPVSVIEGVAYLFEDLPQQQPNHPIRKTFFEWFRESIS
jgi:hypothetical protein